MVDINQYDKEIRTTAVDFSFGELLNLHTAKEILIRPEYQRLFRWSIEQRSRLVESIILGLPIPPIFLIEGEDGVLELIDGLQRTSSILQFLDHEAINEPLLILSGCEIISELNGKTINEIPTTVRLKIKRSPIRATIINKSGDAFVKYEMFKRLNTGGSLLSAQEIRNCSSRMVEGGSSFYDFIQQMADSECFKIATSRLPESFKEKKADEELVLRYFAIQLHRDKYKGNIEEWLDDFMERVLFKKIDFNLDFYRKNFTEVFELIAEKLNNEAFTRFKEDGDGVGRLAPAYYEASVFAFKENYDKIKTMTKGDVKTTLMTAFSDSRFIDATGPGANTIQKLNSRLMVVDSYFKK